MAQTVVKNNHFCPGYFMSKSPLPLHSSIHHGCTLRPMFLLWGGPQTGHSGRDSFNNEVTDHDWRPLAQGLQGLEGSISPARSLIFIEVVNRVGVVHTHVVLIVVRGKGRLVLLSVHDDIVSLVGARLCTIPSCRCDTKTQTV